MSKSIIVVPVGACALFFLSGVVCGQAVTLSGYSEATFGSPSSAIPFGRYDYTYTDADGIPRKDAGVEIGEGSFDSRNYNYWRNDGQSRRHGNLYEMNSTSFSNVTTGTSFALANLRYFNAEIFATTASIYTLPVAVKMNFTGLVNAPQPTFNFDFRLNFTTNNPGPVDDTLEFINAQAAQTFTYGNKTYTVQLKGFSEDSGQTYRSTFQLPEWSTVTSSLYAELVEVQGPRLYLSNTGNIQMQARVGSSVSQSLLVQNSGAPGTTLSGTLTGVTHAEFGPADPAGFTLGAGESVSRSYTYTPTTRTNGVADTAAVVVTAGEAGSEDVFLIGQAYGPVYYANKAANSTISLGRVIAGSGGQSLAITNVTPDGNFAELTNLTIRSARITGSGAGSFNLTGISDGNVLIAAHSIAGQVGTNAGARGNRFAKLTLDTDENAAYGADGKDYAYNLSATLLDKRPINASPVNLGRVLVGASALGSTTISSSTPDNFYTNPTLRAAGATSGGVTAAAATADAPINTTSFSQSRAVSATFADHGTYSGIVDLGVTPENLGGEGNYSLGVAYTATAVRKRDITASTVDFGRVMTNTDISGLSTAIRSPATLHNFFTQPTLQSTAASQGGVTVAADTQNRVFNRSDGSVISSRDVVARFGSSGMLTGSVPLPVAAEGLAGEGTYPAAMNWSANAVANRQIDATTVDFGRRFSGASMAGTTELSSSGADNLYTRVTVQPGSYSDGIATAAVPTATTFRGAQTAMVGVSGSVSTPGLHSGVIPVTAAGGGMTGEGLQGEQTRDLSIPYVADIYSHGRPSFVGGTHAHEFNLNFGTLSLNTGIHSLPFNLYNLVTSVNTANIEFDGVATSAGQTSKLFTTLPSSLSGISTGASEGFSARIDTSTAGAFTAQYVLNFFDDRSIQGGGALEQLTLNLSGMVAGASAGPPRTNITIYNPGFEQVRTEPFSLTDLPTPPGEASWGMGQTLVTRDGSDIERYVPGWVTANNFDKLAGIVHPTSELYDGGYSGTNVAYLGSDTIEQALIGTFDSDETYTFSFKVGRPKTGGWVTPDVTLYLDGMLFEPVSLDAPLPAPGEFATWTGLYRVNPNDPRLGSDLAIRIFGSDSLAHLDDFLLYISGDDSGPSSSAAWTSSIGGYWADGANWSGGQAPNSTDSEARLGSAISRNSLISLNLPVTLGTLRFDKPSSSYDLQGPAPLKMKASTGNALIDVASGSHRVSADLQLASNTTVSTSAGAKLTIAGALQNADGRTLTKQGDGTLEISGRQTHGVGASLTASGGTTILKSDGGSNLNVVVNAATVQTTVPQHINSLSVAAEGKFELSSSTTDALVRTNGLTVASGLVEMARGALIVNGSSFSSGLAAHNDVNAAVRQSFNEFAWDQPGIGSAVVRNDISNGKPTALGILLNNDGEGNRLFYGDGTDLPLFAGETVGANDVLVRYTLLGDGNLDGVVDTVDFSLFQAGYLGAVPYTSWAFGDYDYNGIVDSVDFSLFQAGYFYVGTLDAGITDFAVAHGLSLDPAVIPEPAVLSVICLAGGVLRRRRRAA